MGEGGSESMGEKLGKGSGRGNLRRAQVGALMDECGGVIGEGWMEGELMLLGADEQYGKVAGKYTNVKCGKVYKC